MKSNLSIALSDDFARQWQPAFARLVFAARNYGTAIRDGQDLVVKLHDALECAALLLSDLEHAWGGLAGPPDICHERPDELGRLLARLHKHAIAYARWWYSGRPFDMPFEHWHKIAMLREKAFFGTARKFTWEPVQPSREKDLP